MTRTEAPGHAARHLSLSGLPGRPEIAHAGRPRQAHQMSDVRRAFFDGRGGRNVGTGAEDPLAYVPADSSVVLFIDFGTVLGNPSFGSRVEQSLVQNNGTFLADCKRETGLEFKDLFNQVTYGVKVGDFAW